MSLEQPPRGLRLRVVVYALSRTLCGWVSVTLLRVLIAVFARMVGADLQPNYLILSSCLNSVSSGTLG